MIRPLSNFIFILALLILSSCASRDYEWVKINPDKISRIKTVRPKKEETKQVNVVVHLMPKAEGVIYVENSDDFFEPSGFNERKPLKSSITVDRGNNINRPKNISKPLHSTAQDKQITENEAFMRKLNNALIIPKRKLPKDQKIVSLPRELSKSEVNSLESHPPIVKKKDKEGDSKRNNYLWVGLVLLIGGLIVGLIFGGIAYLISIVGIVLLSIGYFIRA